MNQHPPLRDSELETKPDPIQLAILKISGGDPTYADSLKSMMWHVYQSAGCPHGASEEGCFRWWREELELVEG